MDIKAFMNSNNAKAGVKANVGVNGVEASRNHEGQPKNADGGISATLRSRNPLFVKFDLLPFTLLEKVAIDESARIAYTDLRTSGNPLFMAWLAKNRRRLPDLDVQVCDIAQIAKLREQGYIQKVFEDENSKLMVRGYGVDLITNASKYGASDIHIMMRGTHAEVQFEIQSKLYHFATLFHAEGGAIARAIFQGIAQTRAATFEELAYQNAQISGSEFAPEFKIKSCRIIRGPAFSLGQEGGSFMTIRLQYAIGHQKEEGLPALPYPAAPPGQFMLGKMGYSPKQMEKLEVLMNTPSGVNLILGPVGSGKTSTLFECLQELARIRPYNRQVSVEDPVENPMPWAVQMVITNAKNDEEVGIEYGNLVRGTLRMAPKIIFLGEIRGPAVAMSVIEAAVTGHQLWSTLHCADPFSAIDRLELMDQVALARKRFCDPSIIRSLIAQRLLPRLCEHCKISLAQNQSLLSKRLTLALRSHHPHDCLDGIFLIKEGGCEKCNFTGSAGRFAVAEIVVCDEALMDDFVNRGTAVARKNYRARPGADLPMLDQALEHVFAGRVDPRSVEEAVELISIKSGDPARGLDEIKEVGNA